MMDDRFIYNTGTGGLFFDPDGSNVAGQVQLATLSGILPSAFKTFLDLTLMPRAF